LEKNIHQMAKTAISRATKFASPEIATGQRGISSLVAIQLFSALFVLITAYLQYIFMRNHAGYSSKKAGERSCQSNYFPQDTST
jgi:hypothetical protein